MYKITNIIGNVGMYPNKKCRKLHGTLLVHFESALGSPHPNKDLDFLPSLKNHLRSDGFAGVDELTISDDHMQNTAYVSINMGEIFAKDWDEKINADLEL